MLEQLPKELQALYQRAPEELHREFDTLSSEKLSGVLEELDKLHRIMERGVYEFVLGLIRALR